MGMGYIGNRAQDVMGLQGVWGTWAMMAHRGYGYRGMGHMGNRVQGIRGMGHMGNGDMGNVDRDNGVQGI